MAIKFEKIQPGMTLYDRHRYKSGPMSKMGEWDVRIISVDTEKRRATVSWNSNSPEVYYESQLTKLHKNRL